MNQPLLTRAVILSAAVAMLLALVIAPPDALQGNAQRLMYVHVPAAWTAYLAFIVVALASLRYLRARTARSDALARTAAEVGVVCTGLTLVSGSVWGALTWGGWWIWDARVTTTALAAVAAPGGRAGTGEHRHHPGRAHVGGVVAHAASAPHHLVAVDERPDRPDHAHRPG